MRRKPSWVRGGKVNNNPDLVDETTESIMKIQKQGYDFCFDIASQKYQACIGDKVEYEFDTWEEIIAFADRIHDKRRE